MIIKKILVDFVIRYQAECTLVEVKAATGNSKSIKTILKHPEKYHVNRAIKLGDYNVGRSEQILTLPLYMAFLLRCPVMPAAFQNSPLTNF